jgi:hypothetical protein
MTLNCQRKYFRERKKIFADPEAAYQSFLAMQPMRRYGQAEEIASAATFLVSDEVNQIQWAPLNGIMDNVINGLLGSILH